MKRQSGSQESDAVKKVTKKKTTPMAPEQEVPVAHQRKEEEEEGEGSPAVEEWVSWVDEEEMSWATSWIPFWEVEAYNDALYGDVLWDFDIWDFKPTKNPNPSQF